MEKYSMLYSRPPHVEEFVYRFLSCDQHTVQTDNSRDMVGEKGSDLSCSRGVQTTLNFQTCLSYVHNPPNKIKPTVHLSKQNREEILVS